MYPCHKLARLSQGCSGVVKILQGCDKLVVTNMTLWSQGCSELVNLLHGGNKVARTLQPCHNLVISWDCLLYFT